MYLCGGAQEPVALYDAEGRSTGAGAARRSSTATGCGTPPPACCCAAATARRVYVHRRTADKLVFAGHVGLLGGRRRRSGRGTRRRRRARAGRGAGGRRGAAGAARAVRLRRRRACATTSFAYEARWDGPLHPEPSEIAWAAG